MKTMNACGPVLGLAIALAGLVPLPAQADDPDLKSSARKAGHEAGSVLHDIGRGGKKIGKEIGAGGKRVGKSIGAAAKEGGKEFKRALHGEQ